MIKHNPCLFNKDSPIKMSKDIITSFSRDFLSGEGDVMKHLGYLGYKVDHKQTHLDEFDFAVTNIAVDVRCGVKYLLARFERAVLILQSFPSAEYLAQKGRLLLLSLLVR